MDSFTIDARLSYTVGDINSRYVGTWENHVSIKGIDVLFDQLFAADECIWA
jgi:hypothetical protein